jgi:NADH:ubiquinone oxidoreductase subunit E
MRHEALPVNLLSIEICTGISCHLLGAPDLMETIETLPPDKREQIDLREVSCLKHCGKGPNVRINGIVFPGMTPGRLLDEIEQHLDREEKNV